jgi:hypothetical protein
VFVVGVLTAVDVGVRSVYPELGAWDVVAECIKMAAERRGLVPAGGAE